MLRLGKSLPKRFSVDFGENASRLVSGGFPLGFS